MARQFSIAQIFLWLFVIVLGIEIGALAGDCGSYQRTEDAT